MTIETATPSSAETLAAVFDTLVDAVAARVFTQLEKKLDAWAMTSGILEDRVTDMVQSFVDNQLDLDALVEKSLDNMDMDDRVLEVVQGLNYDVRVHVSS